MISKSENHKQQTMRLLDRWKLANKAIETMIPSF